MAVDFPFTTPGFCPSQFQWGGMPATLAVASVLNNGTQTQGVPGKRFTASMVLPATTNPAVRAAVEAFFDSLNGQAVRVNIYHFGRIGLNGRGTPMGTINTSGVQVNANTAQFATSIVLKGCGNLKTLEPGDMVKIGSQVFMAPSLCTSNGSGLMTVPVTGGLRAAAAVNAAVTLLQPKAQFILASPDWRATYNPGVSPEFGVDWIEAFS